MILFPNCKINIGLTILSKRSDGFHNLQTIFYPLPVQDVLEIIQWGAKEATDVHFTSSGLVIPINAVDNICVKAYHLLKKDFDLPPVRMHLHKVIPTGAGLGGGSADGAFALAGLNKKFPLKLSDDDLVYYALKLGSDCPFFISNKPSLATGRGEVLTPLSLDLKGYKIVIVNPQTHINTGWAFSQIEPSQSSTSLEVVVQQKMETWKEMVTNDFEKPVFRSYPQIKEIKETFYESGAIYASMSGSGSTVYGIFEAASDPVFSFPPNYFVQQLLL